MIIVKGEVRFGDGEIERLKPFAANTQATRRARLRRLCSPSVMLNLVQHP